MNPKDLETVTGRRRHDEAWGLMAYMYIIDGMDSVGTDEIYYCTFIPRILICHFYMLLTAMIKFHHIFNIQKLTFPDVET